MKSDLQRILKRILDVVVASICLILLCPMMALITLAVTVSMGYPVLFRPTRVGYRGKAFTVLKFRTMTDACDPEGRPLSDKIRVTVLGRLLRKNSLVELPQLVNVLRGDMSIVGPRPLEAEYLKLYTRRQARRHEVKPGITGLAQIKGRNALSWEEKFALDVWYVDHASFSLDLRILLHTAVCILRRKGVSPEGDLDVPSFTGSPSLNHAHNVPSNVPGSLLDDAPR